VGQAKQATKYKDDRDDDAIIQTITAEDKEHDQYCLPSSAK
jgi:hypothetical protein